MIKSSNPRLKLINFLYLSLKCDNGWFSLITSTQIYIFFAINKTCLTNKSSSSAIPNIISLWERDLIWIDEVTHLTQPIVIQPVDQVVRDNIARPRRTAAVVGEINRQLNSSWTIEHWLIFFTWILKVSHTVNKLWRVLETWWRPHPRTIALLFETRCFVCTVNGHVKFNYNNCMYIRLWSVLFQSKG